MTTKPKITRLPRFTRATLPDARSNEDCVIVIVEPDDRTHSWVSNGLVWIQLDSDAASGSSDRPFTFAPTFEASYSMAQKAVIGAMTITPSEVGARVGSIVQVTFEPNGVDMPIVAGPNIRVLPFSATYSQGNYNTLIISKTGGPGFDIRWVTGALFGAVVSAPGAPTIAPVNSTSNSVTIAITAGAGGAPASYRAFYRLSGAPTYTTGPSVVASGSPTALTIPGLSNAQAYDVYVTATNASVVNPTSNPSNVLTMITNSMMVLTSGGFILTNAAGVVLTTA